MVPVEGRNVPPLLVQLPPTLWVKLPALNPPAALMMTLPVMVNPVEAVVVPVAKVTRLKVVNTVAGNVLAALNCTVEVRVPGVNTDPAALETARLLTCSVPTSGHINGSAAEHA